jgi:hypothetical protein
MKTRWYSPQLPRDLVRELYFEAKAQRVPMTVLADRLVRDGLELHRLLRKQDHHQAPDHSIPHLRLWP